MSRAIRGLGRSLFLTGCLGLAACGNAPNQGSDVRQVVAQYFAGRAAQEAPAEMPSRAVLDAFPDPLIRVTIPAFQASSILGIAERNGPYETWLSTDRTAIILRDGMLHGTRGLLQNLLSSRVPRIRADAGQITRDHFYSGDNESSLLKRYRCDVTPAEKEAVTIIGRAYPARRISERCRSDTESFENFYWLEDSGKIRKSRQWVGPRVGYVTIEAVNR